MRKDIRCKPDTVWEGKYGSMKVLEYTNKKRILIEFLATGHIKYTDSRSIIGGMAKDPYHKNIFNVGCAGLATTSEDDKSIKKSYHSWRGILRRCYDEKSWVKNPTYKDVKVCEEWLCFEVYEIWYNTNVVVGYHVDKDFTVVGCKLYSPETCVFIPPHINAIIGKKKITSKLLPVGVSHHSRDKIYNAKCWDGERLVHLGDFCCPEAASVVYVDFKTIQIQKAAVEAFDAGQITEVIYNNLMCWVI